MKLMHAYPAVLGVHGMSFGGNQNASGDPAMRRCGCGVVAVPQRVMTIWGVFLLEKMV